MRERNPTERIRRGEYIDGEQFALVVETTHGSITAITAVHRQRFERRIGGARYVKEGSLKEVAHLASAMTNKCLLCNIPADGQKTIIICPEGLPATKEEKAEILKEHIRVVASEDGGVIFGPDIEVGEDVQDIIASDADLRDHVTGLSTGGGGLGIDTHGYTSLGLADAIERAIQSRGPGRVLATVQGYGAVGAHTTLPLSRMGVAIKAVSNVYGTLVSEVPEGIDAAALFELRSRLEDDALRAYADGNVSKAKFIPDRQALLKIPCDLFVPAARTAIIASLDDLEVARVENPDAVSAEEFFKDTGVGVVAEGANYPLTRAAEKYLEGKGVLVLPDIVVNCGGLIGCYFEWAWRRHHSAGSLGELGRRAKEQLKAVLGRNVEYILRNRALGAREAARRIVEENLHALLKGETPDTYGVRHNAASAEGDKPAQK